MSYIILKRELEENFEFSNKKRKLRKFSLDFKLKLIQEAKLTNNVRKVANEHKIDEKCLRDWKKNEAKIEKTLELCESKSLLFKLKGGGRKVKVIMLRIHN